MTCDRKKPGVAFWATVVLAVVLVAYPLSYGPAVWLAEHGLLAGCASKTATALYYPVEWVFKHAPMPIADGMWWYAELWH